MPETQPSIFDETYAAPLSRKTLLPWWIKLFAWFFLIKAAIALAAIILAASGYKQISILGMEMAIPDPFAFRDLPSAWFLVLIGISSFGLLTAKKWAVNATLLVIVLITALNLYGVYTRIPYFYDEYSRANIFALIFQLVIGILFLWKLFKIRRKWANAR